ncbi:hypothetical protein [Pedobacter sp. UBA5917]|uniref:hypothetical protein n=1 Tax=Pedobacter sp. UBA5917 TaxID=1947061 RepID=UPI0025DE8C04|nr:hypothetical protein [Pedobacter sp. UBA5917]
MKKQLFIFLAFIVLALTSNAQVTLQTFQIGQNYLQNSTTLKVPNTSVATPFKFVIITTRGVSSSGGYVSGNCKISLYYTENQSADSNIPDDPSSILLKTVNVTSSDYKKDQATLEDIDASLPPNKQNGKLVVKFEFLDNQNINRISYSTTRYGIYVVPPPVNYTITNNLISLYNNEVNHLGIAGTTPIISPQAYYSISYQRKNANGIFETVESNGFIISGEEVDGTLINGLISDGGTYRRVITIIASGLKNYSNEIIVPPTPVAGQNAFTVTKTEIFDNNGHLKGNNIKIILDHQDPNIRFSVLLFGSVDPYYIPVNKDYEIFVPYFEDIGSIYISGNNGNNLLVIPTWK